MSENHLPLSKLGHLALENFAGIDSLELTVKPFTILIGPQSVGKSVTAKLLFFFKSLALELFGAASSTESSEPEDHLISRFSRLLPDPTHSEGASCVVFTTGGSRVRLTKPSGSKAAWSLELPTALRKAYRDLLRSLSELRKREDQDDDDDEKVARDWELEDEAHEKYWASASEIFPGAASVPRFIPAGRSFYAQIERDMASYFESASLDPFVADFGKLLARLKNRRSRPKQSLSAADEAKNLAELLLSGRYERVGSDDIIHVADGRKLPAKLWSSGQQEVHPLAFILQRYCEGFFRARALFIEEPEAHLFPASQKIAMELIALAFNARPNSLGIFITTHSPYVLTTLNNLVQAGQLYAHSPARVRASLKKIVPEERAIHPAHLGAYYMDRAECRSIVDRDTGLINGTEIDSVSATIAEDFDALLNLLR